MLVQFWLWLFGGCFVNFTQLGTSQSSCLSVRKFWYHNQKPQQTISKTLGFGMSSSPKPGGVELCVKGEGSLE